MCYNTNRVKGTLSCRTENIPRYLQLISKAYSYIRKSIDGKGIFKMEKTGLIFGGGGTRGSYEIGVWMALRDLELEPEIGGVAGTSIGALNMALFAQGDLQGATALWAGLTKNDIAHVDAQKIGVALTAAAVAATAPQKASMLARYIKPDTIYKTGVYSQDYIKRIIRQYVDPIKIYISPRDLYACCCKLPLLNPEYFSLKDRDAGPISSILLASAAIPLAFDAVKLNKHQYYDGGLRDNVPIQPLYELGYRRIIVVNLSPEKGLKTSAFSDAELYVITPRQAELFQGGITKALSFNPETNMQRIYSGYRDAIQVLGDFPAQSRDNLYRQRETFLPAQMNEMLRLKNGFNIMILGAEIRILHNQRYAFLHVRTQMAGNAELTKDCLMLATELQLAFPDGRRSYVDLDTGEDHMYDFPLYLTKGQTAQGYMAFPLPKDVSRFSVIITDRFNYAPKGTNYFMDFTIQE